MCVGDTVDGGDCCDVDSIVVVGGDDVVVGAKLLPSCLLKDEQ